jgi:hypothetical protein
MDRFGRDEPGALPADDAARLVPGRHAAVASGA